MKKQVKIMCSLALSLIIPTACSVNAFAATTDSVISNYSIDVDPSKVSSTMLPSGEYPQNIYDAAADFAAGALNFEDRIDISQYNIPVSQRFDVFNCVRYEFPEVINISTSYGYQTANGILKSMVPKYLFTEEEKDKYFVPFNNTVDEVVNAAGNLDSDISKALFVHDYIIAECEYATEIYETGAEVSQFVYGAYGSLVEHRAVCQGYSMAYKVIMKRLSIDVDYALSESMNHIWNTVTIDGNTYHADLTYDDPIPNMIGYVGHTNFLCTDEEITATDHSDWTTSSTITNQSYPNRFWDEIKSKIWFTDNEMIYADYNPDTKYAQITKRNIATNEAQIMPSELSKTHWQVMGGGAYYLGEFSRLEVVDNVLYYSMPNGINAIALNGKGDQSVYTLPKTATGRIYGFVKKDSKFYIQIATAPNDAGAITEITLADFISPNIIGDVDENGEVTLIDAITVQKAVAQMIELVGQPKINADYNCDGEITLYDAILIQKISMGF